MHFEQKHRTVKMNEILKGHWNSVSKWITVETVENGTIAIPNLKWNVNNNINIGICYIDNLNGCK
jgi:hypothetical protein